MSDDFIIQPPPFGSFEQAETFIKSHEISTGNKYVVSQTRIHKAPDGITSLLNINIKWVFNLASGEYCDGVPYILISDQIRHCQYGQNKECKPELSDIDWEVEAKKRKRKGRTERTYCPAKVWTKTIMKFPEYKVDLYDGRVRKADKKRVSKRLKREFDKNTQHFLMVFVQILNEHEKHGNPETAAASTTIIGDISTEETPAEPTGETSEETPAKIPAENARRSSSGKSERKRLKPSDDRPKGPLLKKGATLKGKNLMKIALDFKAAGKLPFPLAQPKVNKRLESMTDIELISLYHDLTGEVPNEMFSISNKKFNLSNMCLLLHLCIIAANAEVDTDKDHAVHHSVRVKGTEQIYTPAVCEDTFCACANAGEHMHCPLCSTCEAYSNSFVLKKHFAGKHVQHSIEFAGLKILRCLDDCGVSQGGKHFRSGHWHCCMCTFCHDSKKQCLKHFMSHLKGGETTMQVQVLQNVNPCIKSGYIAHEINSVTALNNITMNISRDQVESSAHQTFSSGSISPMKKYLPGTETPSKKHHYVVSYGDGHGVIHNEQQSSVMHIQEDNRGSLLPLAQDEVVSGYHGESDVNRLRCKIRELEQKCSSQNLTIMVQESRIQFLTDKNEEQARSISELKMKYQDLLSQSEAVKKSNETQMLDTSVDDNKEISTNSTETEVRKSIPGIDGTVSKESSDNASSKDKTEVVKQCLDELKSLNNKKNKKLSEKTTESVKNEPKCIVDIKSLVDDIRKDIEQLKVAALLNNQRSYFTQNTTVGGINPLMYIGNNSTLISTNSSYKGNNSTPNVKSDRKDKAATTSKSSATKTATSTPVKTVTPLISVVSVRPGASSNNKSPSSGSPANSTGTQVNPKSSVSNSEGQKSSPVKEISDPRKVATKSKTNEAVSNVNNEDVNNPQTESKMTDKKKNNSVIVALKPGSSSRFSKTEIEQLVNAAVQKMDDGKTQETSTDTITEVKNT